MDHPHARAYFLAIVTTILCVLTVYMFRPFLVTIGLAAVFAVMLTPLNGRLLKARLPRGLAALLTLLIGVICVLAPLSYLSVQLFSEAESVYTAISNPASLVQAQAGLNSLGVSLEGTIPGAGAYLQSASENISTYVRQGLGWSLGHAGSVFSGTLNFVLQLFVFMMTLYYLIKEGSRLKDGIKKYSPLAPAETTALTERLVRTINSVVRGTILIALLQGFLAAVGFTIFGVPNGILWGTVAFIAALIPTVGTGLVFIPAILYLLFMGSTGSAIGLAIFGFLIVGLVDNFLRPYLVAGNASIHPLLVLLSVLGGLAFFGPGGLFLGPLVISLFLGLLYIYAPAKS